MKRILAILLGLTIGGSAIAEDDTFDASEVLQSAAETLQGNEVLLNALGIDKEQAEKIIAELNEHFQGTYVYDLSAFHETAEQIIPILQQMDETRDYAAWLQSRLDYFQAAENLRKLVDTNSTNQARLPDPSPQLQRRTWVSIVEERPMPPLAKQHVPALKEIFIAERVPPELVWIAEVESSFNTKARSPAGAAGLFQLMPATAENLDLSTGVLGVGDERLDPKKSGRAAARYLHQLKDRFGDWRLALAAYNAGEGRVGDLLKRHKGGTFETIASRLPAETQMYVPKVEAIVRKREGVALSSLKTPRG